MNRAEPAQEGEWAARILALEEFVHDFRRYLASHDDTEMEGIWLKLKRVAKDLDRKAIRRVDGAVE